MERSFARAGRYGFKRERWRGLWRVQIQEYLIAAVQNIETLIRHARDPRHAVPGVVRRTYDAAFERVLFGLIDRRLMPA